MFGLQPLVLWLTFLRGGRLEAGEPDPDLRGAVAVDAEQGVIPLESGCGEGAVDEADVGVGAGEDGAVGFFLCDDLPSFGRGFVFEEGAERRSGRFGEECS